MRCISLLMGEATFRCGAEVSEAIGLGQEVDPTKMPSRPGEFHPEPLTDPDLTLSRHPARATRLTRANGDGLPPSLHEHYTRFIATARQSAPLRRIGTFGLAVGAACAFSLSVAGQVLTFRTRA